MQRTYTELHPYRSDEYLPFNSVDCNILVEAGLPQPQEVDDLSPMLGLLRQVATEAATMYKGAIKDSHATPEDPGNVPLPVFDNDQKRSDDAPSQSEREYRRAHG